MKLDKELIEHIEKADAYFIVAVILYINVLQYLNYLFLPDLCNIFAIVDSSYS